MAKYSQLNLELHISTYLGISTLHGGWYMLVEALSRLAALYVGLGVLSLYAQPENPVGIQVSHSLSKICRSSNILCPQVRGKYLL